MSYYPAWGINSYTHDNSILSLVNRSTVGAATDAMRPLGKQFATINSNQEINGTFITWISPF